jgi:hypothetical protein
MVTKTGAIKAFLTANTHRDLAALYSHDMECQVNVAKDNGTRVDGEFRGRPWVGWTDGSTTWKAFRIPRNAATNPEFDDSRMTFDLNHAEGIGMTGWDWKNRISRWVAFDFDEIIGHKEAHKKKMAEDELEEVKRQAQEIDWVTVRKSAGGRGLHLYVFFEPPVPCQNHNEHAALARSVLGQMSALAKFDFNSRVDICGHNMWVYHRKMKDNDGLALIKQGWPLEHVPANWKDHIKVISGHGKRNLPSIFRDLETNDSASTNDAENLFLELTGQAVRTPLDDEHKRFIQWLEDQKARAWWDADHHMLVTHTYYLKKAHEELSLRGIFQTDSKGTEAPSDHNCFMFPIRRGGWTVRRYSLGVREAPSWDQDGQGWTRCYYNCDPTLQSAARIHGGVESATGAFVFEESSKAKEAAETLGARIPDIPSGLQNQRASIKTHKDGRLFFEIEGDKSRVADKDMSGWLHEKGKWRRLFNVATSIQGVESEAPNYDDLVRHVITQTGSDFGWMIKGANGSWRSEPLVHVATALQSMNLNPKDVKSILGNGVIKCWKLVNRPFQPEYPGDRMWNREAAQFRFVPKDDIEDLHFPTWKMILDHCGRGLDEAIQSHPWAVANGLKSGSDYLKVWISSLFKEPTEPLPYLFFWGPQDSGKSMFHEALSLLITRGYQRADAALINPQGFNEELMDAIICVIEEINLRKSKDANNRIKDWVTARQIPIHPKGRKPYHVINTTHWIQCSNDMNACPVFPGDTRVTMIYVDDIPIESKIPKKLIIPKLESEAADFLSEIMHLELPPSNDRLNVPMIATMEKVKSEDSNKTPLERFISDQCHEIPGALTLWSDFYHAFEKATDATELSYWTKIRVGRELPMKFPKGRNPENSHFYIANLSLVPDVTPGIRLKAVARGSEFFLVPENDKH